MTARTLLLVLLLAPVPAFAQQNGNVRNGLDYQPTKGGVQAKEKAAGILPPQPQQRARTDQVDGIYDQLMSKERGGGAVRPSVAPLQPGAAPAN